MTSAFWMPVRLALVPNLVPHDQISAAVALHATLFNLARFLGPAVAAPILANVLGAALRNDPGAKPAYSPSSELAQVEPHESEPT